MVKYWNYTEILFLRSKSWSKTSEAVGNASMLYVSSSHIQNWFFRRCSRFTMFTCRLCPKMSGSDLLHITIPSFRSFHARWWKNESTDINVVHSLISSLSSSKDRFFRKSSTNCFSHSTPTWIIGSSMSFTSSSQCGKFFGFSAQLRSFCANAWSRIIETTIGL